MSVEWHLYALSSVAGIHAERLRLKLAVQENFADLRLEPQNNGPGDPAA